MKIRFIERQEDVTSMNKICIVPFTCDEWPIALTLNGRYSVVSVVSPNGIGLGGNDIGILKNREMIGIRAGTELKRELEKCDTVLISKCKGILRKIAIEALDMAIDNKKNIICFLDLTEQEEHKYLSVCKKLNVELTLYGTKDISNIDISDYKLKKINIPVIYVGEIVEKTDSDEIFFNILNFYQSHGYKVLGLTNNIYSHLYGQIPISFLGNGDFVQEIFRLNCYINSLIEEMKPDIIVLRLPKPMLQFSNYIHYDFGISAYMISQAISPDELILCTPIGMMQSDLYETLQDSFYSKFGVGIRGVHIGNQIVDNSYENVDGEFELSYDSIDHSIAFAKKLHKNGYQVYNLTVKKYLYQLLEDINSEILNLSYGVI